MTLNRKVPLCQVHRVCLFLPFSGLPRLGKRARTMQTFAPRGRIHGPILPQFVLETSVSFGAKIMYALLCNYASDSDRCWPSQATLAARLSCSVSSVKKYLAELVGINLIQVRREQYRSSVYYLLQPAALKSVSHDATDSAPYEAKPASHRSDSACEQSKSGYLNTLNKQEELNTPPLPPVRPVPSKVTASPLPSVLGGGGVSVSDFEKAWALYPKKEAKGLACAAWKALQRQGQLPTLQELESSIRQFMASDNWQREQGRFVPQMSNWLRGQRWLDMPSAAAPAASVAPAARESEATRQAARAIQAMLEREAALKAAQDKEREALRPRFEAFAAKFPMDAQPWLKPMAFGLWMHLHNTFRAPAPSDVPADNLLSIVDFLRGFKGRCEQAAWQKSPSPQTQPLTSARFGNAVLCGDMLSHHPLFSQRPPTPVFSRAM